MNGSAGRPALRAALGGALALALAAVGLAQTMAGPGDRFDRRVVTDPGGRPIVYRYLPRDSTVVEALAAAMAGFAPAGLAAASLPPDSFVVVVAPTESAFRQATGGRAPDWGLAVAFPRLRRIVLRSPRLTGDENVDPATVLRHELNHLYLDLAAGDGDRLPRWFNEGFAALYADEWRWVDPVRLAWARLTGSLVPLERLEAGFPPLPPPRLAYVQSLAAVRDLRDRGGDAGLRLLVGRVRDGATFDAALRATYGLTLAEFYAEWERSLGTRYGPLVALSDDRWLWIAMALVVLVGWALRRRAVRREIDRRRRREDAALGDPDDHSLGVEWWERTWEHDDEDWKG